MKTQSQQPAHTKGEWSVTPGLTRIVTAGGNKTICSFMDVEIDRNGKEENEANAERIVKAVNEYDENKRRADMHDAFKQFVTKIEIDYSNKLSKELQSELTELLKQAEQK